MGEQGLRFRLVCGQVGIGRGQVETEVGILEDERLGLLITRFLEIETAENELQLPQVTGELQFLATLLLRIVARIRCDLGGRAVKIGTIPGIRLAIGRYRFDLNVAQIIFDGRTDTPRLVIIIWRIDVGVARVGIIICSVKAALALKEAGDVELAGI